MTDLCQHSSYIVYNVSYSPNVCILSDNHADRLTNRSTDQLTEKEMNDQVTVVSKTLLLLLGNSLIFLIDYWFGLVIGLVKPINDPLYNRFVPINCDCNVRNAADSQILQ